MIVGAVLGIVGVLAILGRSGEPLNLLGIAASAAALVLSSLGAVLTKRWADVQAPVLATTAWQLLAGGLVLVAAGIAAEGAPPAIGPAELAGFAFVSLVATALAFVCWFGGLRHLSAGSVGVIGLLNPVTGVLLGAFVAAEAVTPAQLAGIALVLAGLLIGQRGAPGRRRAGRDGDARTVENAPRGPAATKGPG
jgi:probable blue pigment (indigoidine) exporter